MHLNNSVASYSPFDIRIVQLMQQAHTVHPYNAAYCTTLYHIWRLWYTYNERLTCNGILYAAGWLELPCCPHWSNLRASSGTSHYTSNTTGTFFEASDDIREYLDPVPGAYTRVGCRVPGCSRQPPNRNLTFYRLNAICFIYGISPYRAVNTLQHSYKNQSVNDILSRSCCLFRGPYKTLNATRAPCTVY
jgi:hypothetical protein